MRFLSWKMGLAALAVLNLSAGIWMSTRHPGVGDLQTVASWSAAWAGGVNPYASDLVDYPPWALVLLWPLAASPNEWRAGIWVAVNVGLAALLLWRLTALSDEPPPLRVTLALLMAATACLRTLSQFSLLSYALGVIGAFAASRTVGSIALGASLIKPQIGGVAFLWVLLRGDWHRAAAALAVPLGATTVFMAVANVDPITLFAEYQRALSVIYSVPARLPGHSELRPWLWAAWPHPAGNLMLTAVVAIALFLPAVSAAVRLKAPTHDQQIELLALCGAASLLSMRHLSYDFILLLPALVAWAVPPFASASRAPRWLFVGLAGLLVIALPSWWRVAARLGAPPAFGFLTETDRLMCLGAWAALSWRLNRSSSCT